MVATIINIVFCFLLHYFSGFFCLLVCFSAQIPIFSLPLAGRYGGKWLPWWLRWQKICLRCRRPGFDPWVGKIPWRREQQHTPVFLPVEFHGQRTLVGLSPRGCKASDTTEWPTHHALVNTDPIPGASEAALAVRSPSANAGGPRDAGATPGSGRCPGGGNGNPRQYSCLGNPEDQGAWRATVHRIAVSWTQLSTHIRQ